MSLTLPIIVYGNGDLFAEYFNAIVATFGMNDFNRLLRITILLAGFTASFGFIFKQDLMVMVRWLGLFYLVIYVLFLPQASVIIVDRINGNKEVAVDHVPLGLSILASYTSVIGDTLTRTIESNFTMPDYMPYHKTGMVFASQLFEASSQFEITDAVFDKNLSEFVHQCIFYDVLLNKYSLDALTSSTNIWELVSAHASPARAFIYNDTIYTCKEGITYLTRDWKAAIDNAITKYSERIYPSVSKESAKSKILVDLPLSYSYLTHVSESATTIMQQNLMENAIQRGVVSMGTSLNATAAIESYAYARAQEQKRLTNKTIGDMAAYWLPLMKNAFEAIMYGSFIFILLLSIFPFGLHILKNYLYTLVWLQTWAPLYAIINLIVSYYAQIHSSAAAIDGLSLKASAGILQINSDIAGLAGYLTLTVPFISAGLVKSMAGTFTHISQFVGGVTQSTGGTAAAEGATGNMSFGNTSLNNHNNFNTSSNHLDTSGRVSSGTLTTQDFGGSLLTKMSDGSVVMDMKSATSSLPLTPNIAGSIRESYSNQAEHSTSAALNDGQAFSQSMSNAMREMNQLGSHLNNSEGSSEGWTQGMNADVSKAFHSNKSITQDYASKHGLSYGDAANVLSNAYIDSKLSASLGVDSGRTLPGKFASLVTGIKGGASASGSTGASRTAGHTSFDNNNHDFSDAHSYIQNSGYSENVNVIERASHDHSLKVGNEMGNRYASDMSASFDKAESARSDMQSNWSQAESARQYASYAEEKANSINENASQRFKEWVMNQPGTDGKDRMGYSGAAAVLQDPKTAMHYGSLFMEQYKQEIESGFKAENTTHNLPATDSQTRHRYESNNHRIKPGSEVRSGYENEKNVINEKASNQGLTNNLVDHSIKTDTENKLSAGIKKAEAGKSNVTQSGSKEIDDFHTESSRYRHGGLLHDLKNSIDTKE
jgi:conjugal transfer mating pair stabilization protein TraG